MNPNKTKTYALSVQVPLGSNAFKSLLQKLGFLPDDEPLDTSEEAAVRAAKKADWGLTEARLMFIETTTQGQGISEFLRRFAQERPEGF